MAGSRRASCMLPRWFPLVEQTRCLRRGGLGTWGSDQGDVAVGVHVGQRWPDSRTLGLRLRLVWGV